MEPSSIRTDSTSQAMQRVEATTATVLNMMRRSEHPKTLRDLQEQLSKEQPDRHDSVDQLLRENQSDKTSGFDPDLVWYVLLKLMNEGTLVVESSGEVSLDENSSGD